MVGACNTHGRSEGMHVTFSSETAFRHGREDDIKMNAKEAWCVDSNSSG
jgi:hypothetical protein